MPPSNLRSLSAKNFMRTLPYALAQNETISALAQTLSEQFETLTYQTNLAAVLTRINELPETVLDILSRDFRVDWYDSNASVEQKRRLIKTAFDVHRHKGTKAAVETAVSAVTPGATVREWFEYGGNPYRFRVRIPIENTGAINEKERLVQSVNYYKNARSHLDTVEYALDPDAIPPAPLRLAPVMGDVYIRLTIPAPVMPQNVALYGVTVEDGDLWQVSLGDSPTLSIDDDGYLCQEYDPETEQPRTLVIEDGVLYEEVESE